MRYLFLTAVLLLIGCATTRIVSQDPYAEIFMDEHKVGVGSASVDRVGPYHTAQLEARRGGTIVGSTTMNRSFTFKTLLWGMFSYYTGFYWGWYYPESVEIPLKPSEAGFATGSGATLKSLPSVWTEPRQSIWMRPLK